MIGLLTYVIISGCRGCQVVNCSKLYCLLFSKDAGNYLLGSAHYTQKVYQEYHEDEQRKRESVVSLESPQPTAASTPVSLPASLVLRDGVLIMTKLEEYVRNPALLSLILTRPLITVRLCLASGFGMSSRLHRVKARSSRAPSARSTSGPINHNLLKLHLHQRHQLISKMTWYLIRTTLGY